jgi:hypothetical protein
MLKRERYDDEEIERKPLENVREEGTDRDPEKIGVTERSR